MTSATVNTSEFNLVSSASGGVFAYSGQAATGNLYFSLAPVGGSDNYGNTYPTGLSVQAGQVQGVSLIGTTMDSTSTLQGTNVQNAQVLTPSISGGTAASLVHTMTNTNGSVLGYTSSASAATFATNGVYQWTVPTGITSIRVQTWAAGGGADGGENNEGGASGGGGEYAEEPSYAVSPGQVLQVVVGMGGTGGLTGNPGGNGGLTTVYPSGGGGLTVTANPGQGGNDGEGGAAGSGSNNTIHWDGGNGINSDGGTGGAGGGGSGGPTAQGNPGNNASGATGGAGGTAVSGGGAGGAGGNAAAAGTNGSGPGGGGGGAGFTTIANSKRISYEATTSRSWYGADAGGNANKTRVVNGTIYQGGETTGGGNVFGTQKSAFLFPQAQIQSDWTSYTITAVQLWVTNQHAWYNNGIYIAIKGWAAPSLSDSLPESWNGVNPTNILTTDVKVGQRTGIYLPQTVGQGFAGQLGGGVVYYGISFGPGVGNYDLNYYGYFNGTPNSGAGPVLTISGNQGGSAVAAGNGADGQVIITYGSASTPVYQLSVSAVQGTDSFGNPIQQGFQGPQFTVTGNQAASTVPTGSTVTSSAAVNSNTSGQIINTNTSGFTGLMPVIQTDIGTYTNANNGTQALTKAWTIPAGDGQVGTVYEIQVPFNGTFENQTLAWKPYLNGSTVSTSGGDITTALDFSTGSGFQGTVRLTMFVKTTGSGGTVDIFVDGGMGLNTGRAAGSNVNFLYLSSQATAVAFNTTISNTIAFASVWGGSNASQTITGRNSVFTRKGP